MSALPDVAHTLGRVAPLLEDGSYLGPATVLSHEAARLEVRLPNGERCEAQLALAYPAEPQPDDELLVIGKDDACYVIGLLRAEGEIQLRFAGSVAMHAEQDLLLEAEQQLQLRADKVELEARHVAVRAGSMVESARELFQRVRDTWTVRAGRKEELVAGEWCTRADNANLTTVHDVSINGRQIRLG